MTLNELYKHAGGDYEAVLKRLGSKETVGRFNLKFLADNSFSQLNKALKTSDVSAAFRAAHTLKGVSINLGFENLYRVSAEITEALRKGDIDAGKKMFCGLETEYNMVINCIGQLDINA